MLNKSISTYIIIGGKSSRMGTDKANFSFGNKSFLMHIIDAVKPITSVINLVSSLNQHQNLGYRVINDLENDKGPVCAITSPLSDSNTEMNIILSCDIPFIKTNLLNWLLKQHSNIINRQLKLMHVLNDIKINVVEVPEKWKKQVSNINTVEQLNVLQA